MTDWKYTFAIKMRVLGSKEWYIQRTMIGMNKRSDLQEETNIIIQTYLFEGACVVLIESIERAVIGQKLIFK